MLPLACTRSDAVRVGAVGRERDLPPIPREFRGVWVATVANIDWPSQPGLSVEQQQAELRAILDRAAALRLNAIVFQVRPACDALYRSELEPWSEFLTGTMGRGPTPAYDPLSFAVDEAHRRGLELHAWFNPFRARAKGAKSAADARHVSNTQPGWVRKYADMLWLDPGEADARAHSLRVIRDVAQRYDIDGVHLDDYFYPYPQNDAKGKPIDFPDDATWSAYQQAGGNLTRDDWRRANIDAFVQQLYEAVKSVRASIKVGISPFGIWRPGNPPQIRGMDAYAQIYADSRRWLMSGWVDYLAPQLYWPIAQTPQSFPVLLDWWLAQNAQARHVLPGIYASKSGAANGGWPAGEIAAQIAQTRDRAGTAGHLLFSMKPLLEDRAGLTTLLDNEVYLSHAIAPPMRWLDARDPATPRLRLTRAAGGTRLDWSAGDGERAALYVLRFQQDSQWRMMVLPGSTNSATLEGAAPAVVALSAVDRCGNVSPPAVIGPR